MAKNKKTNEDDDFRIISRLIKELSRLDEQEKKIRKAEKNKIKAIQEVLDRINSEFEEKAEENENISILLQELHELVSKLRKLLSQ